MPGWAVETKPGDLGGGATPGTRRMPLPIRTGLRVVPGGCEAQRATKMTAAITEAGNLAAAGVVAATSGGYPFDYFFNAADKAKVTPIMQRVVDSVEQHGEPVDATCKDYKHWCQPTSQRKGHIFGYVDNRILVSAQDALSIIVLCPRALASPQTPESCGTQPPAGVISPGYVMLHELMHVTDISRGEHIGDLEYGVDKSHELVVEVPKSRGLPTLNADNYAWFALFAWLVGFGQPGKQTCSAKFGH